MKYFFPPVGDPTKWTYSIDLITIPVGLRYAGYTLRAVKLKQNNNGPVKVAAEGTLKQRTATNGQVFVELQMNPRFVRRAAGHLEGGLPTCYYVFPSSGAPATPFYDDEYIKSDITLHNTTAVTFAMMAQDRVTRDPALYAELILKAIKDAKGDASSWQLFTDALDSAFNTLSNPPVLILDHRGMPLENGSFELTIGASTHQVSMKPADEGNLQKSVARMNQNNNPPIPNLFGTPQKSFTLRPLSATPNSDFQLVRLEDGKTAAITIKVEPAARHILLTNLHDWFAQQCASNDVNQADVLKRYWRGCKVTPFVNGPAFFDDLFRELHDARRPQGGFHLCGWSMMPGVEYSKVRAADPTNLKTTLKDAAEAIGKDGGRCCFLPAQFIQLGQNIKSVQEAEIAAFLLLTGGLFTFDIADFGFARTDGSGMVLVTALAIAHDLYLDYVIDQNGRPLEKNKAAVDDLNLLTNVSSRFSPYPARVEDQLPPPDQTDFPFDVLFKIIRHLGVYHQKLSIVKNSGGYIGYCGGIDLSSNRLDDTRHLRQGPYHDVHCRIDGPAVHDLALTFDQLWQCDGGGEAVAFSVPDAATFQTPGKEIVQVARTYFKAAPNSNRALVFAPKGDRTIANSMLKGIKAAREFIYIEDQYFTPPQEYRDALLQKVESGDIKKLIVALPGANDQPFGDIARSPFIAALKKADAKAGGDIFHIGYPRRHFTVPDNELRAASGKCILMGDLKNTTGVTNGIILGPKSRLPVPPFWVAIEGELIYLFDEESLYTGDKSPQRSFKGLRGDSNRLFTKVKGAKTRAHKSGAAATVVNLDGIYVHAKIMIVDDVFMTIGSANLNRRGLFHDGECNIFSVPETLKVGPDNPIRRLRHELWAEMLNLPHELAAPLLDDPVACTDLFLRNSMSGNRYTEIEAQIDDPLLGSFTGTDTIIMNTLNTFGLVVISSNHKKLFNIIADPTTGLEKHNC